MKKLNHKFKKCFTIILAGLLGLSLTACSSENSTSTNEASVNSAKRYVNAMDTYMTIKCYGDKAEEAADAAVDEINRLDELLSVGKEDSELSKINAAGKGEMSEDTKEIVETALEIYEDTDGAFDITVYPLMVLWGFTTEDYKVPSDAKLKKTLSKVGSDRISIEGNEITLGKGQGIDVGGIAKGYTSDRLMEIFEEYGLTSAEVSLGGNVELYKTKPDGSDWKCAIKDPNDPKSASAMLGILKASDCAIISSGAYERNFTENGVTYHHIIDPSTGYPSNSGLKSVTIVSKQGIVADGLSTACYVMGLDKSIEFWKNSKFDFDMILMTDDNEVYITKDLESNFTSSYSTNIIEK